MREIIFRGMTVDGQWVLGCLSILKKDLGRGSGFSAPAGHYISNKAGLPFAFQVRPETVGQFTGIVDKNGVKIFEGDIVRPPNYRKTSNKNDKTIVEINNGNVMSWTTQTNKCKHETVDFWQQCEIIGTIHDQKEDV